jgi:hypothetical protein
MAGERTFVVKFVSDTKDAIKGVAQMNSAFVRFSSNVEGRAMSALKGLVPSFKQVAAVGVGSFVGLAAAAYKFTEAASEDQKAQALLVNQIKEVTFANQAQIDSLGEYIDKMQMASGVADDQLRPALANLVRGTGSLDQAQKLLALTLDISAGSGKGVEEVSLALAKAASGQVTALTRLGIPLDENAKKTKDFGAITQQLADTFKGASTTSANTFAGGMARLKLGLGEVGESIGYILLPYVERFVKVVNDYIVPALKVFVENIKEKGLKGAFELAIASMGDFSKVFLSGMKGAYIAVLNVVAELATMVEQIAAVGAAANAIGGNIAGALKGTAIALAAGSVKNNARDAIAGADQLFNNLADSVARAADELWRLGRPTRDVSDAAERAAQKGLSLSKSFKDTNKEIDPPGGGGLTRTLQTAADKLKKYTDALKNTTSAQKSFASAQRQTLEANKNLNEANADLASAQEKFNQAVAGYGVGSDEANKAQRELDAAQRGVARAGFRVEESVFAVKKAEEELAKVRLDPESTPMAIREAEIALAEAKLAVADAQDDEIRSQEGLSEATNQYRITVQGAVEGDEIYRDLADALADAKDRQEEATIRAKDAIDAEREALEQLIETIGNLQGAYAGAINVSGVNPFDPTLTQIPQLTGVAGGGGAPNGGRPTVQVTVNAGLGASGQEVGAEIAEYLRQYATVSGVQFSNGSTGALFGR